MAHASQARQVGSCSTKGKPRKEQATCAEPIRRGYIPTHVHHEMMWDRAHVHTGYIEMLISAYAKTCRADTIENHWYYASGATHHSKVWNALKGGMPPYWFHNIITRKRRNFSAVSTWNIRCGTVQYTQIWLDDHFSTRTLKRDAGSLTILHHTVTWGVYINRRRTHRYYAKRTPNEKRNDVKDHDK